MSSWKLDPATGDYVVEGGNPVTDETLKTPAYIRLKVQRLRWLYAPSSQYGSDYYASHIRIRSTEDLEKIGNKALKPLVDDLRAKSAEVITTAAARGSVELQARIVDDLGQVEVLTFTPLGVK